MRHSRPPVPSGNWAHLRPSTGATRTCGRRAHGQASQVTVYTPPVPAPTAQHHTGGAPRGTATGQQVLPPPAPGTTTTLRSHCTRPNSHPKSHSSAPVRACTASSMASAAVVAHCTERAPSGIENGPWLVSQRTSDWPAGATMTTAEVSRACQMGERRLMGIAPKNGKANLRATLPSWVAFTLHWMFGQHTRRQCAHPTKY